MDTQSPRRQATRTKLYEAAVTLIAEQGFSATTVDEIAERAGVAKGTVYYNFKSKTELFEELLRHGVGLLTASLRSAADETAERGGTRVEALDAMIRAGLVFIDRYPAFTSCTSPSCGARTVPGSPRCWWCARRRSPSWRTCSARASRTAS